MKTALALLLVLGIAAASDFSMIGYGFYDTQDVANASFLVLGGYFAPFFQTNGNETQAAVATNGVPVQWQVDIDVVGYGTCAYNINKLAVISTTIYDSGGFVVANTGTAQVPRWACNAAGSTYVVDFTTEAITQIDEGAVAYATSMGTIQRRVLLSSTQNQSVSFSFSYPVVAAMPKLFACPEPTSVSCGGATTWTPQTFNYVADVVTKTITTASNETVFVVAWDYGSSGSGGGGTGVFNQTNATINVTQPPAQPIIAPEMTLLESMVDYTGGITATLWEGANVVSSSFVSWLGQSTLGISNTLIAFLIVVLSIIIAVSRKTRAKIAQKANLPSR